MDKNKKGAGRPDPPFESLNIYFPFLSGCCIVLIGDKISGSSHILCCANIIKIFNRTIIKLPFCVMQALLNSMDFQKSKSMNILGQLLRLVLTLLHNTDRLKYISCFMMIRNEFLKGACQHR